MLIEKFQEYNKAETELSEADAIMRDSGVESELRELAEEVLRQLPESKSSLAFAPLPSDDPKRRKPDITLAKELLGWEPKVALGDGLARTIEYFRSADKLGF